MILKEGKQTRRKRRWKPVLGVMVVLLAAVAFFSPISPVSALRSQEPAPAEAPREKLQIQRAPVEAKPVVPVVPESEPVTDDSYFSDAVFLGDSRTEGFHLYSGLEEGRCLYSVGATVSSVFKESVQENGSRQAPLLDVLSGIECRKVYVMLGVNELGWPQAEQFQKLYRQLLERVQADHPDAVVVIQSILPVSRAQDEKGTYVNNQRITEYNEMLQELAIEKNCPYMNVAEAVSDENGCLREEWTPDGVHLNKAGTLAWLEYLRSHPLEYT